MRTLLAGAFFAGLIGCTSAEDAKSGNVEEKLGALLDDYNRQKKAFFAHYRDLSDDDKQRVDAKIRDLDRETGRKAFLLGRDWTKDEAAVKALCIALRLGSEKTNRDARELLISQFADDPKIVAAFPWFSEKHLLEIDEKTKNRDLRGAVRHLALVRQMRAVDPPQRRAQLAPKVAEEKYAEIARQFDDLAKDYGDVVLQDEDGKAISTIAKEVEKNKYFIANLTVGKVLPDSECELLDGRKTKISDYRGKVVVLDVWATTCVPCRALIPHERELVQQRRGKPLEFISLSLDDEKKVLAEFLEKEKMPWTQWWASPRGKLADDYQIQVFPTIFVLDSHGVIRCKFLKITGNELEDAVDALLTEMESPAGK